MSAVVCIAVGNSLRGDDGVAHRVLQLLQDSGHALPGQVFQNQACLRDVVQLTPELAIEIAGARTVIFIDADPGAAEPHLEPVPRDSLRRTPLTHGMTPAELVELAERWYSFTGAAFLCRVPAASFEGGEALSAQATEAAAEAARRLREFLLAQSEPCVS